MEEDTSAFCKRLLSLMVDLGDSVEKIVGPDGNNLAYYRALYPDVMNEGIPKVCTPILRLAECLRLAKAEEHGKAGGEPIDSPALDYSERIVNILDYYLEDLDHQLDLYFGRIKDAKIHVSLTEPRMKRFKMTPAPLNVIRPDTTEIFEPKCNPYEKVIEEFTFESFLPLSVEPTCPDLDDTPLIWVDTPKSLQTICKELASESLIGLDLEHHNTYSYNGLTCLIQISSPSRDYLIDAIKLRTIISQELGPILHNPDILKIMHGAESDNIWLQRDFGLFIVGLFDTYFAAKALGFPRLSFAHILSHYCGIDADKSHQLSDWRQRPLPEDMIHYARQDTHYLMYIFEQMKADLISKSHGKLTELLNVLRKSSRQSLTLFRQEKADPESWRSVIQRSSIPWSKLEQAKVKVIFEWRDRAARIEDVSLHALLPNPFIIRIAQASTGSDPIVILNTVGYDFSYALKHVDELRQIIRELEENSALTGSAPTASPAMTIPTHIIFHEDVKSTVSSPVPAQLRLERPLTIAKTVKSNKSKGGSMFDAFSFVTPKQPHEIPAHIIEGLPITKVGLAAQALQASSNSINATAEASEIATDHVKDNKSTSRVAKSLLAQVEIKEEELGTDHDNSRVLDLALSKGKSKRPEVIPFDFTSAHRPGAKSEDCRSSFSVSTFHLKDEVVQIEEPKFESSKKTPKLSTKPRSGNRSMTFY